MTPAFPDPRDLDWIFFDLDGTLWDHPSAMRHALWTIFGAMGMDMKSVLEHYARENHILWEEFSAGRIDMPTLRVERFARVLGRLGAREGEHSAAEISQRYLDIYLKYRGEYEESSRVIEAAADTARIAVLTNAPRETQDAKFDQLRARHRFAWMLTTDEANAVKTDARFYDKAEELAAHPDPRRVLYVGDSWTDDIVPGHARGWWCVWIAPPDAEQPAPLDRVSRIATIGDLLPMLRPSVNA